MSTIRDIPQEPSRASPRILMWGTYDLGKPRTRIIRECFRTAGLSVEEIHYDPWRGIEDKSQLGSRARQIWIAARLLVRYPLLIARYLLSGKHDLVFVGYMGLLDVLLIAPFARLRAKPVVWDAFLSVYDTTVVDRGLLEPSSRRARLLRWLEKMACRLADVVVLDTQAHARLMADLHMPGSTRFRAIMVGCEDGFRGGPPLAGKPAGRTGMDILFYGQFIPLHGIETIVRAAQKAADRGWTWTLIGKGQESDRIDRLCEAGDWPHIRRVEWMRYDDLADRIGSADVCLGIFGASRKAASVIPNKVFQILAAGKPLVTRDSPAIRELLRGDEPGIYLVEPSDPDSLLAALDHFARNRAEAAASRAQVASRFGIPQLAAQWRTLLEEVVSRHSQADHVRGNR